MTDEVEHSRMPSEGQVTGPSWMRSGRYLPLLGAAIVLVIVGVAALLSTARQFAWPVAEVASGTHGMVSSAHPLATDAGLKILEEGGNAFDAAVAVAAVLNVVEPMMSGIGGYGTILTYDVESGRARFLNPSGRIPKNLDSDVFRPPTPGWRENRRGARAVSTPGNANAWEAMWRGFGRLEWFELFTPAIELASTGFILDERTAGMIAGAWPSFPGHARAFYGVVNRPLQAGELLVQTDLAESLRLIAEQGARAVHGGVLGEAIHRTMEEAGGFLTIDDLRENRAEWWDPVRIDYRGYQVVTASPPANSFPALVRLGMMSRFDVEALGHNTVSFLHRYAEVTKHAFWVRLRYASDPDVRPVPLEMLLSEAYWQEQVDRIDPEQARPFTPPGVSEPVGMHTTHFVVADRWGNVVSATQTLGNAFGSRIMPEGTGIWLNNSLAYSTFEPKGNPMDAFPGRHKLSGDAPTLIMKDGMVWAALGTPGGHTIPQTVPQMVMNLIDFGMDVGEAISAPRISFVEPDRLTVEEGVPATVRERLTRMGHNVRLSGGIGLAHALIIWRDEEGRPVLFQGAADPRGSGSASGLDLPPEGSP